MFCYSYLRRCSNFMPFLCTGKHIYSNPIFKLVFEICDFLQTDWPVGWTIALGRKYQTKVCTQSSAHWFATCCITLERTGRSCPGWRGPAKKWWLQTGAAEQDNCSEAYPARVPYLLPWRHWPIQHRSWPPSAGVRWPSDSVSSIPSRYRWCRCRTLPNTP